MDEVRRDIKARGLQLRWADLPRGPELQPYFPMVLHAGFSRAGHIIQCENSGLIDPGGILDDFGQASRALPRARTKIVPGWSKLRRGLAQHFD